MPTGDGLVAISLRLLQWFIFRLGRQNIAWQVQLDRPLARGQRRAKRIAEKLWDTIRTGGRPCLFGNRPKKRLLVHLLKRIAVYVALRQHPRN